tara:strand:- start:18 stop:398 length:381 start_codon:yes stop_codon:yes gene_type:complete
MIGEVRVFDGKGKLKKIISSKILLEKLYDDNLSLRRDINLKPSKKGYVYKKQKRRYLKCNHCGNKMETTARRKMFYCTIGCGDTFRVQMKKDGVWEGKNTMKELIWDRKPGGPRGIPNCKSRQGPK